MDTPAGHPTLQSFRLDFQIWADQENAAVIGDVEKFANSGGSTASVSSLISGVSSADQAASGTRSSRWPRRLESRTSWARAFPCGASSRSKGMSWH